MVMDQHAIAHETGHLVVALHLGISVESVEVSNGFPLCNVNPSALAAKSTEEQCIFLCAGAAGELRCYNNYNQDAFQSDSSQFYAAGESNSDYYIKKAGEILTQHNGCFHRLRNEMARRWAEEDASAEFSNGPYSFVLLSHDQIGKSWTK